MVKFYKTNNKIFTLNYRRCALQTHIHFIFTTATCLAAGASPENAAICGVFATAPDWPMALQTVIDKIKGVEPLKNRPNWLKKISEPSHSIPVYLAFFLFSLLVYTVAFLMDRNFNFLILAPSMGALSHVLLDRLFHGDPDKYPLAGRDPSMFWPFQNKINMTIVFKMCRHDYRKTEGLKMIPEKWPERIVALTSIIVIGINLLTR